MIVQDHGNEPQRGIECYEKMSIRAAKNMLEAFDGVLDPGYVVNPETLPNRRNV